MTPPRNLRDETPEAIIYCRVSDKSQLERGNGIDSQENTCREYAERRGYKIVGVFQDDLTGKTEKRPGIKELLVTLKKRRRSTYVIIDHGNRLARSLRAHYAVRDAITTAGGKLESPLRIYTDNPDDDFDEIIEAAVAGEQRRQNAEQTTRQMRGRCLGGHWCLQLPRGYRYRPKQSRKDPATIERLEPVATIIQSALEGYACGSLTTQADVARFLASQPGFPHDRKNRVTDQVASNILTNPFYAGYVHVPEWNVSLRAGDHPALISFETFQKIQRRRLAIPTKRIVHKHNSEDFALRGYVACSCCGTKLAAYWAKGRNAVYPYYHCREKSCEAYSQAIPRAKIEGEFANMVQGMQPSAPMFAIVEQGLRQLWSEQASRAKERKAALSAEIRSVQDDIRKIADRTLDTSSPSLIAALEERLNEAEARKAELQEKVAHCATPTASFDAAFRTAMVFLSNPWKLWETGRLELRQLLLKIAFAKHLEYAKNSGFRTPLTASTFRLFQTIKVGIGELVHPTGRRTKE